MKRTVLDSNSTTNLWKVIYRLRTSSSSTTNMYTTRKPFLQTHHEGWDESLMWQNLFQARNSVKVAAAAAKSRQSCLTLCNPIDSSPHGSPIPGILQVRTLEWVISFSNAWEWKVKVKSLSRVRLLATSWIAAYQAPPSMGFSRQEYWSGVPLPSLQ